MGQMAMSCACSALRSPSVIMIKEASTVPLRDLVKKLIPEVISKEIEKQTMGIFPLKDALIRKVKILKKPKFDITKLMELHADNAGEDLGAALGRPDDVTNALTAEIAGNAVADAEEE